MNRTIEKLKQLRNQRVITEQQYRTYKGQVIHGNEIGCIKGLKRMHLLTDVEADALFSSCKLAEKDRQVK